METPTRLTFLRVVVAYQMETGRISNGSSNMITITRPHRMEVYP